MKQEIPEVEESEKIQVLTSIWMVPFIALVVALWLAWQYFSQMGPEVKIVFESSAGLKVNQSQVKMRDVPIGIVKNITLLEGQKGVLVTVRMNNDTEDYLNKDTKFWIAKPQIDTNGISGLDTLMSGSYVAMHAKKGEGGTSYFIGLEEPYIDKEAQLGKRFKLSAPNSRDLSVGANVYYRKIKVGELESLKLSNDGEKVDFTIFIKDDYTKFVNSQTQFWRTNNLNFDFSANSLRVDYAPIADILNGGISFSSTTKTVRNNKLNDKHVFALYKDYAQARQKEIGFGGEDIQTFQFQFDEPIGKLEVGAPIDFYGFQVGHVVNIESDFDTNKTRIRSVVIGLIDTSVFVDLELGEKSDGYTNLKKAVSKGLKARLAQSNPLTGSLYIELANDKKAKAGAITSSATFARFPTFDSNFDGMMDKVAQMMDKINNLKLEELLASVNKLIDGSTKPTHRLLAKLTKTVDNLNKITGTKGMQTLPDELGKTLAALEETLGSVNKVLAGDGSNSVLAAEINTMLKELTNMSKSVQQLTDKLDKKPNALIFGDE